MNGEIKNIDHYEQLACAIVFQAIKDYAQCIKRLKYRMRTKEEESFFQEIKQLMADKMQQRTAFNNRNGSENYRMLYERVKDIQYRDITQEERKRYRQLRNTTINEETRKGLKAQMKDIENFVKSKWYGQLTSINPEILLNRLHAMKNGQVNWQAPRGRKKVETQ